ncbi:2-oxoacid:acceptor oxidoreductase family protein [Chloroflexota bacterium]
MSIKEIRIAGFGGQGVVLSGNIIGKAASIFGTGFAALTQSYGPESRGGSCCAEVIISDKSIDYPYVTSPGVQIILSQDAYTKYGRNTPLETLVIVDSDLVKVDPTQEPQPLSIPASRIAREEIGRPVVANIIMLGFMSATSDIVSVEALKNSVLDSIPPGTESVNLKAFEAGHNYGVKHGRSV